MIFRELEFLVKRPCGREELADKRAFRVKINHVIDSIFLRLPRIKTKSLKKLNCYASNSEVDKVISNNDGYVAVHIAYPNVESIWAMNHSDAVKCVKIVLRKGLVLISNSEPEIKNNLQLLLELVDTGDEPFDYVRNIKRSHKSRKFKCYGVVEIRKNIYSSVVIVSDKLGNSERFCITEVEPFLGYVDLGFDKLLWEGDSILGFTEKSQAFRLKPSIVAASRKLEK